jgi:mannose-6-phosphate isomerase-like protein (cupin superfamily)
MTTRWNRIGALLVMLGTAAAVERSAPANARDVGQVMAVNPRTLEFRAIPGMPGCASAAILRGDPRSGPAWVLLKLDSGCRVPSHWHTPNEELVVISGRGTLAMKDGKPLQFAPGAYASLPSHHVHQTSCSRACLLFNSADGAFDIHYVDASGKEISLDKAMSQSTRTKARKK